MLCEFRWWGVCGGEEKLLHHFRNRGYSQRLLEKVSQQVQFEGDKTLLQIQYHMRGNEGRVDGRGSIVGGGV